MLLKDVKIYSNYQLLAVFLSNYAKVLEPSPPYPGYGHPNEHNVYRVSIYKYLSHRLTDNINTSNDNLKWSSQIFGKLSSLNRRLFMVRRLKNSLNQKGLRKVAESLFISKLRYGLQLCGKITQSKM